MNLKSNDTDTSIILIVVYFGAWPPWFEAYLTSCRANPTINWLFFTDCPVPDNSPANVRFVQSSRTMITELCREKLNINANIPGNRKLCDIRPTYGHLFEDFIKGFGFWGFCDIDIIWGNVGKFYDAELLGTYDVISARKARLSGHFTILRNDSRINLAYRDYPKTIEFLTNPEYCWFDEKGFFEHLKSIESKSGIRILADKFRLNYVNCNDAYPSLLSWLDRYHWRDGNLYSMSEDNGEIMYLHFMNWKDSLKWSAVTNSTKASEFFISYSSINLPDSRTPFRLLASSFLITLLYPKYYLIATIRRLPILAKLHKQFKKRNIK